MSKKQLSLLIFGGVMVSLVVSSFVAQLFAWQPSDLEDVIEEAIKPIAVKVAEPQKTEEPPPPQAKTEASLLSTLAPDSFSGPQDLGSGVSFGSGGHGPAVGGGGGFGTDASQLVKDRSNMNRPPRAVMKGALDYPMEARQRNISGFVILKILVSTNGGVENVEVEESEPRGYFDQAAMKSVKAWKFEPAMIKGQIVAAWTSQKIKFELN